ncbi:MAG: septum formation protein Maf [Bdellovibrionales bacterium]|nr:septum formation protein Maf [Bdellovibrionales bacterium]
MNIILASQSPNRKKLLLKAGIEFKVFVPDIEEKDFINPKRPSYSCLQLARLKALKAKKKYPKNVIIGCDQMAFLKGKLFGKALTKRQALENLIQLQGKTHNLFTAVCILWEHKSFNYISKSSMTMRGLTVKQIKNYISKEKPLFAAGSYHIESSGISLFKKIKSEDFNSIEGLPLIQIINQLIKWGYPLFQDPY